MSYFLSALKKYAVFNGRAQRAEYWYFVLFYSIIWLVLLIVNAFSIEDVNVIRTIVGIYSLAMLLPMLAVSVRRLHDIGKSGWMIFIQLIPLVGAIWFIVLMATNGNSGDNEYGPNPKMAQSSAQS